MFARIREDIETVFARDPAARTVWEVVCCYPGLHAIWIYRLAHALWTHRLRFLGRLVSHANRFLTGVEIHPGATIGRRFFIDHGMGVVIGETAEIGDDVLMYQDAVLGGTSMEKVKRHPTVGSNVVIGAGAILLGPIVVGDRARIGAGSVVVKDIPAGATVVGVPARIAETGREAGPLEVLEHARLPDPGLRVLVEMTERQERLESRVDELSRALSRWTAVTGTGAPRGTVTESQVLDALREVIDPEVGINVVDFGLIQEVRIADGIVEVTMTLTSALCPLADHLTDQVRRKVASIAGGMSVSVVLRQPASTEEGN
jgi:serine O-acetyltransferase